MGGRNVIPVGDKTDGHGGIAWGEAIEVIHPVGEHFDRTKRASMSCVMHIATSVPILLIINV
jgi:hypothetical protein